MSYSLYDQSLYTDGIASLGMNAIVQNSYTGNQIGSPPYAGNCPSGSSTSFQGSIPAQHTAEQPQRGDIIPTLADLGNKVYHDTIANTPVTAFDLQCCPDPGACQDQVAWRAAYKGCSPTYFADAPSDSVEVAPLGDRYWVADLSALLYERSIAQQAEPDPYSFMNARQMWMQFAWTDMVESKDRFTRPLSSLDQSYAVRFKTQGAPRFTNF